MEPRWLGAAISRHRRALGMSQEAVAHAAGISSRSFADVERGSKRSPSIMVGYRIAAALYTRLQAVLDDA
jgi:DNA-binding XRE family transcriptional regulator